MIKEFHMNITEKQKRIIGVILLVISILIMIGWTFGYDIPIPGIVFWIILALGIVFLIPNKKIKEKEIKQ